MLRKADPALMALAPDVSLARLALGMQRIELLLQSFLGGFAGIDCAAQGARPRRIVPASVTGGLR